MYAGQAIGDRRRDRRERFLSAATELFGTQGYAATSVPQVCRMAGLSTRQFYQEFRDREHLLTTLYDEISDRSMQAVAEVVLERIAAGDELESVLDAGVRTFLTAYRDPREAKIAFVEVVGVSPTFEDYRHQRRVRWAELLGSTITAGLQQGLPVSTASDLQWGAFIGAVNAVIVERARDQSLDDDEVVHAIRSLLRPGVLGTF